jgi:hypothetical protein
VAGIYVKNLATGAVRSLIPPAQERDAVYPRWSPDGRSLAYALRTGGVWVVPRGGGEPRQVGSSVLTPSLDTWPPVWSRDGRRIYFTQTVSAGPPYWRGIPTRYVALFSVGSDGSDQRRLKPDLVPVAWSPEGDALVVHAVDRPDRVLFARPDGKCLTFVAAGTFVGWLAGGNPPPPAFECVDLTVRVSVPALTGRSGTTYAIVVANEGTQAADATLRQSFPAHVTPVAYDSRCTFSAPVLTCPLGVLQPESERTLSLTVRAASGALASTLRVETSSRDSNPLSNETTAFTRVHRCWIVGTEARDVLRGTARGESICGLGGNDVLVGGGGRDTFDAGYGDDFVDARDGAHDTIGCGRGNDRVRADRIDTIARNCERISRA